MDVEIGPLFRHLGIVIKRDPRIVGALGKGEDVGRLDFPDRDLENVRENKGQPVIVDQPKFIPLHRIVDRLLHQALRNEAIVGMEEVHLAIGLRFVEKGDMFVVGPKTLRLLLVQDMRLEHMPAATKHRIRILLRLLHEQRDIARQRLYVVVADQDEVAANEAGDGQPDDAIKILRRVNYFQVNLRLVFLIKTLYLLAGFVVVVPD